MSAEGAGNKKPDSHELEVDRIYSLLREVMLKQQGLQRLIVCRNEAEEEAHKDITVTAVNPEKVEVSDPNRSCLQMAEGSELEESVRKWRERQDALRLIFDDPTYELPKASLEQTRE
jgi:hypothetical protein